MENIEVSIFDPSVIEIGGREGLSVEGNRVLVIALALHSYKISVLSDASVTNVLSCFGLSLFIEENDGVEVGLSSIIPYPSLTRVVRVLEVTSKGRGKANGIGRGRGPSDSRLILCKANWFVTVNTVFAHIWFGEV